MPHLEVGQETLSAIVGFRESGMDYTVVEAECVQYQIYGPFVIRSNGVTMPYRAPRHAFYDFEDLFAGKKFPENKTMVELKNIEEIENDTAAMRFMHYPFGYVPTRGSHPLLATTMLQHDYAGRCTLFRWFTFNRHIFDLVQRFTICKYRIWNGWKVRIANSTACRICP